MNVYSNKNLIISRINNEFYSVVNPLIANGLMVINRDQYNILSLIKNEITIEELQKRTKLKKNQLIQICTTMSAKDIVNFSGNFTSVGEKSRQLSSFSLWVHTTNRCCLRCSYCNIHTIGKKSIMSGETIEHLLHKIVETVKNHGLKRVTLRLSGGEPLFQWEYWKNSMQKLKFDLNLLGCELRVIILTNLVLLTDEIIDWIIEEGIYISVSFDGIGKYQDMSRHFENGEGSFNIVVANLDKLMNRGIYPLIMTVVSNNNVEGLPELTEFLIEHNLPFRYSFVQFESLDIKTVIAQMKKCFNILSNAIDCGYPFTEKFNLCDLKFLSPSTQTCTKGFSSAAVYVDGDIYFCHTHFGCQPKIGSIFDNEDLIRVIQAGSYYTDDISAECKNCNLKYVCTSGCPLEREQGKDPHCMAYKELVPIVYNLMGKEEMYHILNNKNNI